MIRHLGLLLCVVLSAPGCPPSSGPCGEGQRSCDGRCVDVTTDPAHCGACGLACPAAGTNAAAACVLGTCRAVCAPGFGDCDGDAANGCETATSNSTSHCGVCGRVCASARGEPAACTNGRCTPCPTGLATCGSTCADTTSNPQHCGACGVSCGPLPCVLGVCATPPGLSAIAPARLFGTRRTLLTLTGARFSAAPRVRLNGREATDVQRLSATELTVRSPPLGTSAGPVTVEVVNDDGLGVSSSALLSTVEVAAAFSPPTLSPVASAVAFIAAGDLDGDGQVDVAAPRPDAMNVTLLRGEGNFAFGPLAQVAVNGPAHVPVVADVTGDGRLDVLVTGRDSRQAWVLRNAASGFTASTLALPANAGGLALGDLTGDGVLDLVVGSTTASMTFFSGAGDGSFAPLWPSFLLNVPTPFPTVATLTGRAAPVALVSSTAPTTQVFGVFRGANTQPTSFSFAVDAAEPGGARWSAHRVRSADLDDDGVVDLVVSSPGALLVFRGRPDGNFEPAGQALPSPTSPSSPARLVDLVVADVTRDGVPDLVVSETTRLRIYVNRGGATFGDPLEPALMGAMNLGGLAVADVDQDGALDVLVTSGAPAGVLAFQNVSTTQAP
ncbi:MAG: FG-GAP-like repeat-containing protein [Myxococcaceae bacterium]|nr:FG-GAP-like repeat-containing protein [Myxococcaceae bacterium]